MKTGSVSLTPGLHLLELFGRLSLFYQVYDLQQYLPHAGLLGSYTRHNRYIAADVRSSAHIYQFGSPFKISFVGCDEMWGVSKTGKERDQFSDIREGWRVSAVGQHNEGVHFA